VQGWPHCRVPDYSRTLSDAAKPAQEGLKAPTVAQRPHLGLSA